MQALVCQLDLGSICQVGLESYSFAKVGAFLLDRPHRGGPADAAVAGDWRGGACARLSPGICSREGMGQAGARMARPGRNQPCPCGSGRKYKNCCLKRGIQDPAPPAPPEPLPGLWDMVQGNRALMTGIAVGGLALFAAVEGLLKFAWLSRLIVTFWQRLTHWFWDACFFWLKVPLNPIAKNALTMMLLMNAFSLRAIYLYERKGEGKPRVHLEGEAVHQLTIYGMCVVAVSIVIVVLPASTMTGKVSFTSLDLIVPSVFLLATIILQNVRVIRTGVMGTAYVNTLLVGSLCFFALLMVLNFLFDMRHYIDAVLNYEP
jgi:hypothetical protein